MKKLAEVVCMVREHISFEENLKEIALRNHWKCYSLFVGVVVFTSACVLAFSQLTGWGLSIERASTLLQTIASVQIITLSIVFSLIVLGVQNAGRQLPESVSKQFFNIPLFRLTSISIVVATIFELITYALITNLQPPLRDFALTFVLTLGILTLPLLLFSVVVFPSLISIQGLLEQTYAIENDQLAVEETTTVIRRALERNDIRTAEQALFALRSFTNAKVIEDAQTPMGISPILGEILERKAPRLVETALENEVDSFHEPLKSLIQSAAVEGVRHDSFRVLSSTAKSVRSISARFQGFPQHGSFWLYYVEVYGDVTEVLLGDELESTPLEALTTLSGFPLDVADRGHPPDWNKELFAHVSNVLVSTFEDIYRIIAFNFDPQSLPIPEDVDELSVISLSESETEEAHLNDLQQNLVNMMIWICNESLEFDSTDNIPLSLAPSLSVMCTTVYLEWGKESGLRLIGFYLESAFLFSEVEHMHPHWDQQFVDLVSDIAMYSEDPDNVPEEIVDWYNERGNEMQYLTEEGVDEALPAQSFATWMTDFLHESLSQES